MIFKTISYYNDVLQKIQYTWGQASCKYLFSYPKYEVAHIPMAWPVINTYFLIQNMKLEDIFYLNQALL